MGPSTFAKRLDLVLKAHSISQAELARRLGVTRAAVNDWVNGRSQSVNGHNLINIAAIIEVHPQWLLGAHCPISQHYETVGKRIAKARVNRGWSQSDLVRRLEAQAGEANITVAGLHMIEHGMRMEISPSLAVYAAALGVSEQWLLGVVETNDTSHTDACHFTTIPHLSAFFSSTGLSQGPNCDQSNTGRSVVIDDCWFQRWLSKHDALLSSPNNLAVINGDCDSMQGTFEHGDMLFVDAGISRLIADGIYVINLRETPHIKRLQHQPDGSITVISDNIKYLPYTIPDNQRDSLGILGRVIGRCDFNFERI